MNDKAKYVLKIQLILFITLIINGLIAVWCLHFRFYTPAYFSAPCSVLVYFLFGRMVVSKFKENDKKFALILSGIIVVSTYIFLAVVSISVGFPVYILYLPICSPVATLISYLFADSNWSEIIMIVLSPISVFLIWFFSLSKSGFTSVFKNIKNKHKKSETQDDDSAIIQVESNYIDRN